MKAKKIVKGVVLSAFLTLIATAGAFAAIADCVGNGEYANLSTSEDDEFSVRCISVKDGDEYITIYGKSSADCTKASSLTTNPEGCNGNDLNTMIKTIINGIIFAVGMVAVVMIILGGVSYATSQGDPGKVKKGKDTIMYGIIGLVISILAFAIINFVLNMVAG